MGESLGARRKEERASDERSSLRKTGTTTPLDCSLPIVLFVSLEIAGLLLSGFPSPALFIGVRDPLLEQVKLLTELEEVADTHCIHALFREFGNFLEGRNILIRAAESLNSQVFVIMIMCDDPP